MFALPDDLCAVLPGILLVFPLLENILTFDSGGNDARVVRGAASAAGRWWGVG